MIPKVIKYNLHYDVVRGDFLRETIAVDTNIAASVINTFAIMWQKNKSLTLQCKRQLY